MEGAEPISLALTQDSIPLRALPISLSSFNFSCLKSIAGKQGKGMNHVVLPYIGLFSICSRQRGKISAEHGSPDCSLSEQPLRAEQSWGKDSPLPQGWKMSNQSCGIQVLNSHVPKGQVAVLVCFRVCSQFYHASLCRLSLFLTPAACLVLRKLPSWGADEGGGQAGTEMFNNRAGASFKGWVWENCSCKLCLFLVSHLKGSSEGLLIRYLI